MNDLVKFLIKLAVTIGIAAAMLTFVFSLYRVSDNNMFPNFKEGDLVIAYRLEAVNADDVVLYKGDDDKRHLGRVIANSGDVVSIEDKSIILNGAVLSSEIMYDTNPADGGISYPYDVSDDSVFLMNDYRLNTNDSRTFGEVKKSDLEGKVIFILRRRSF